MASPLKARTERPSHLSQEAVACLEALAREGLGNRLSLGGALGLLHYLDYRPTFDVDAWWEPTTTEDERRRVIDVIQGVLAMMGQVRVRAWGDIVSVELLREGRIAFSFQIGRRTARLRPPAVASWIDVLLDSLDDLLASKMVALVERGAPRDFRDVYALHQAGLVTPMRCWDLWRQRQRLAGSDASAARARLAIETHLARIAQHRPLDQIEDPEQRTEAARLRAWFTGEFLDALT